MNFGDMDNEDHVLREDKPHVGQEFESESDAFNYYNEYAGKMGFGIRREYGNKNKKTGEITSRKFVCTKEGFRGPDKRDGRTKYRRPETRTGCLATMVIVLDRGKKKYRVSTLVEEHNHPLHIPECMHMLPSQRRGSNVQGCKAELAIDLGLTIKQSQEFMDGQVAGRENLEYTRSDLKSFLRSKRQRDMKYGEAASLLSYFQEQLSRNPSFYYAIQLDSEERMTNIFWADARMIIDYGKFGDVVTFDTLYKTNKEYRPCSVFAGFNHHRQVVIFGGALLYDETAESFQWLFETFLQGMSQKAPKTIFTDHDPAIAKAILEVMPETYHALCIWHLMRNVVKNLACVLKDKLKTFMAEFNQCVFDCDNEASFQVFWDDMLSKFNLQSNAWVDGIFQVKEKWARPYMKQAYTLGVSSTQASGSLNSELKDYLKSDLDLLEFFKHFNRVVEKKHYNELVAEYQSRQKLPNLGMRRSPMLRHASEVYTPAIFKEFQEEFDASLELVVKERSTDGGLWKFVVAPYNNCDSDRLHEVVSNPLSESVSCICRSMESRGILCSHALKVLDAQDIKLIPKQYVHARWTRDARSEIVQDFKGHNSEQDLKAKISERYRILCPNLVKLAAKAAECAEATQFVAQVTQDLSQRVEEICHKQMTLEGDENH